MIPASRSAFLGRFLLLTCLLSVACSAVGADAVDAKGTAFFESKIRPILVKHCYECHSEQAQTAEGGLLLDRRTGWMNGGDSGKAILPGEPDESLLVLAVRRTDDLAMPPESSLSDQDVALLTDWVRRGAPGPRNDMGDTEFSRLGDQTYLFDKATEHWAFQPVVASEPPEASDPRWNNSPVDRFLFHAMHQNGLSPSPRAELAALVRRLSYDLTGLPPSPETREVLNSTGHDSAEVDKALDALVDQLLESPAYGEHIGRMWLDVVRYADTDSFYRPDTRTPHYFPFAFTYRDYVIQSFNVDKPFDQFVKEQLAADLMEFEKDAPEQAAIGFLTVGPHANRNQAEAVDDWIDVSTRGLMGLTAACARCHDHKYEPIPTTDYYALHGVFSSVLRVSPIDDSKQPLIRGYEQTEADVADYTDKRAAIEEKITKAGDSKAKGNNRSVAQKIRETEIAELLLFHPGAPVHTMTLRERPRPSSPFVFLRGDPKSRGEPVARRFLTLLDPAAVPFPQESSGRLQLANSIVDPSNPLTARVFVNRVWGSLLGSHLVATPSDFGLQGSRPTHPELLDWLTADFVTNGWSTKRLVKQIVLSQAYQQSSRNRNDMAATDGLNDFLWRANRKRMSIEAIRDSMLAVTGELDRRIGGRAERLWGPNYTRRRTIYGYINRFNLDPTLRAFDFPTPMQTHGARDESIVAPQALFTMNSVFAIDRATALIESGEFQACETDQQRIEYLFSAVYQRKSEPAEVERVVRFLQQQQKFVTGKRTVPPFAVLAQSLLMSNEFQYVD